MIDELYGIRWTLFMYVIPTDSINLIVLVSGFPTVLTKCSKRGFYRIDTAGSSYKYERKNIRINIPAFINLSTHPLFLK